MTAYLPLLNHKIQCEHFDLAMKAHTFVRTPTCTVQLYVHLWPPHNLKLTMLHAILTGFPSEVGRSGEGRAGKEGCGTGGVEGVPCRLRRHKKDL